MFLVGIGLWIVLGEVIAHVPWAFVVLHAIKVGCQHVAIIVAHLVPELIRATIAIICAWSHGYL